MADENTMLKFLKTVTARENIDISDGALQVIVKKGGGSFRDTLSLLDQISTLSDKQITQEMIIKALGLPQDEKIAELLASYKDGDVANITLVLKELLSSGIKAETLAEEIIAKIIEAPETIFLPLLAKLPEVKAPFAEAKILVALTLPEEGAEKNTQKVARKITKEIPRKASSQTTTTIMSTGAREESTAIPAPAVTRAGTKENSKDSNNVSGSLKEGTGAAQPSKVEGGGEAAFDWENLLNKTQQASEAIYSQLKKTKYEFDGKTLHIYPPRKIIKNILTRDNNLRILNQITGNVKITIHDENETPVNAQKDEVLAKISDIMGGEVENDRGGDPF